MHLSANLGSRRNWHLFEDCVDLQRLPRLQRACPSAGLDDRNRINKASKYVNTRWGDFLVATTHKKKVFNQV